MKSKPPLSLMGLNNALSAHEPNVLGRIDPDALRQALSDYHNRFTGHAMIAAAARRPFEDSLTVLQLLHDCGVDAAEASGPGGQGCLWRAHSRNIDWLVQHGCDPRTVPLLAFDFVFQYMKGSDDALLALHKVVEHRADVNTRRPGGNTPVIQLADDLANNCSISAQRARQLIPVLLDLGVDLHARNRRGTTALAAAISAHSLDVAQELLRRGARFDSGSSQEDFFATVAIEKDNVPALALLRDAGSDLRGLVNDDGLSLIDTAVKHDAAATMSWLLEEGLFTKDDMNVEDLPPDTRCGAALRSLLARQAACRALQSLDNGAPTPTPPHNPTRAAL